MDERTLALQERQLRRYRREGSEDDTPISVPLKDLEGLVAEVHRLQHCSQCGTFQEENICLGCD